MLNFSKIDTEDGFYEASYAEVFDSNLNDLPQDFILDIVDSKFPDCRLSKKIKFILAQLHHQFKLTPTIEDINIEQSKKEIQEYIYSMRKEIGFFVYDNEVSHNGNCQIFIDWSFQRQMPVDTGQLFADIQMIHKRVESKAMQIFALYRNKI